MVKEEDRRKRTQQLDAGQNLQTFETLGYLCECIVRVSEEPSKCGWFSTTRNPQTRGITMYNMYNSISEKCDSTFQTLHCDQEIGYSFQTENMKLFTY